MAVMFDDLPKHYFRAILVDPPWPFATWSHKGQGRNGEAHYSTMTHGELKALPVGSLAAPHCVLFIWIVQTQIPQAIRLIEAWGFKQKSIAFLWVKGSGLPLFPDDIANQMGMGKWTRAEFEQCWLATRGNPVRIDASVRQVLFERRREHSRKPDSVHERIERLVSGPYLELFARQRRRNWTVWGKEVDKFPQYNAIDDINRSVAEGFRVIRERKANDGTGWDPK
jgi:N6-adenosine-specific RNA methylase IME4